MVIHISFEPRTGVLSVIMNLYAEHVRAGIISNIVIFYSDLNYYNIILNDYHNLNITFIKVKSGRFERLFLFYDIYLSNLVKSLSNKLGNKNIHLIFHDAHYAAVQLPFFRFSEFLSCKLVFHGCPNGLLNPSPLKLVIHYLLNFILIFSDVRLVGVSKMDIELITKKLFFLKNKFSVIYNGVPKKRNNYSLNFNSNLTVGFLGSLDERKRWWIPLEALEICNLNYCFFNLLIAGTGEGESRLLNKVNELTDSITFLGEVKNPYLEFFNKIDLLLLSSSNEGLPMVILEAFSLGIPVISTSVGGIPEVVRNGYNGLLVGSESKDFSKALIEINDNRELLFKFSKNAFKTINSKFLISSCAKKYLM